MEVAQTINQQDIPQEEKKTRVEDSQSNQQPPIQI